LPSAVIEPDVELELCYSPLHALGGHTALSGVDAFDYVDLKIQIVASSDETDMNDESSKTVP
jgi:hypothetical protein